MKNKKRTMPIAIIAFAAIALMGTGLVVAHPFFLEEEDRTAIKEAIENEDYDAWHSLIEAQLSEENFNTLAEHHNEMSEKMQAIQDALDSGDYDAWVAAMNKKMRNPLLDVITEENFDTFVRFHEAQQSGDFETAQQLADELGLNNFRGRFHGNCMGMLGRMNGNMQRNMHRNLAP